MAWIVIDTFDMEYPHIVCNEEGLPLIFEDKEEAEDEALDCQRAIVVHY
jgi:hypothetical protein